MAFTSHERGGPAVGLVDPADPAVLVVPARQFLQPLGDLRFVVGPFFRCWHVDLLRRRSSVVSRYITTPPFTMIVCPVRNAGRVRSQKDRRAGHILGRAPAAERGHLRSTFRRHVGVGLLAESGLDEPGRQDIDPDVRRHVAGERLAEARDRRPWRPNRAPGSLPPCPWITWSQDMLMITPPAAVPACSRPPPRRPAPCRGRPPRAAGRASRAGEGGRLRRSECRRRRC